MRNRVLVAIGFGTLSLLGSGNAAMATAAAGLPARPPVTARRLTAAKPAALRISAKRLKEVRVVNRGSERLAARKCQVLWVD